MEGGSTGNSRRKSYTAKFKLEVVEVAKEILNAIDSFNVVSDEEFLGFE